MSLRQPPFLTRVEWLKWKSRIEALVRNEAPAAHTHTPGEAGAAAASHTHALGDLAAGTLSPPLTLLEQASPPASTPTGTAALYAKNDGLPYWLDDVGTERPLVAVTPALHDNPDLETWGTSLNSGGTSFPYPTGWSAFWMGANVTVAQVTDRVSGAYAARFTTPSGSSGTNVRLHSSTIFDVQAGDIVTVGVWAKAATATSLDVTLLCAPSGTPEFFVAGTVGTTKTIPVSTSWRKYAVPLVVNSGCTRARITMLRASSVANTLYIDATESSIATPSEGAVLTGSINMWPLSSAPAGYLLCDGTSYNEVDYPNLAAVLGSSGGTFTVPDYRDVFPVGASGTKAIGTTGGSATKTIGTANLPPHTHLFNVRTNATAFGTSNPARGSATGTQTQASTEDGGFANTPLDVMNPWRAVSFIIKT